jgi:hypothetical protein
MKTYAVIFTPRAERQIAKLYADIADASGQAGRRLMSVGSSPIA